MIKKAAFPLLGMRLRLSVSRVLFLFLGGDHLSRPNVAIRLEQPTRE